MPAIDDLIGQLPIDQLAGRLGIDPATATSAISQALPALVGGLSANAQDPGGASSLAEALSQHAERDASSPDVDAEDGAKIVGHIFGDNADAVAHQLGSSTGLGGDAIKKLLPLLAPAVLAFLAKRATGGGTAANGAGSGGGGLTDLLGGLLGGGGGITDLLGGLLGGGRKG